MKHVISIHALNLQDIIELVLALLLMVIPTYLIPPLLSTEIPWMRYIISRSARIAKAQECPLGIQQCDSQAAQDDGDRG